MKSKEKMEIYGFNQVKDELLGKEGTPRRDQYEFELKLELLGEIIKSARKEQNLTQEELGKLVGVQKAQISKLESSANNVSIETILRVFDALKAKVMFKVELLDNEVNIA